VKAARTAKSRAVQKIVLAVKSVGTKQQQALALQAATCHPELQSIAKSAGYSAANTTSSAEFNLLQMEKMVRRAVATKTKEGRPNHDKASFVESIMTSISESPNTTQKPSSMRAQSSVLGLPWSTGRRLLKNAKAKRGLLSSMESGVEWSRRRKRKRWQKISQDVRDKVYAWIVDHEMVVESPIANDALLKLNLVTGEKERVPKLLLQIPVRELHNDLLKPVEEGGLLEARDNNGRALISDTALRSMMPEQLRRATERHKQMCGCEICITVRSLQQTLNAWRKRHINNLKNELHSILDPQCKQLAKTRLEEYQNHVLRPGNKSWHERPSDAVKEIQCPAIDGIGLPKWKCVLRRCDQCPAYRVPAEEKSALNDSPRIFFHSYLNTTKCSKHGDLKLI